MNDTYGQLGFDLSGSADQPQSSESKSPVLMAENGSLATRFCKTCSIRKPLLEFYKDSECLGGHLHHCKDCCRADERRRKLKIPEAVRTANFRKWRKENRAAALMTLARYRANKKGLAFTLDQKAIQGVIDAGVCELTGIPFNLDGGKTWDSPSLDRINNAEGYTPQNVRVVLYCINVMANIWGENKIVEIADAIMAARRSRSNCLQDRLEAALKRRLNINISPEYELTWKKLATPVGRSICQLRASGRRTDGSDCSGWPIPCQSEPDANTPPRPSREATGRTTEYLGREVAKVDGWPTPNCDDPNNASRKSGDFQSLTRTAQSAGWPTPMAGSPATEDYNEAGDTCNGRVTKLALTGWPTPRSEDSEQTGAHRGSPDTLNGASKLAGWATPTVQDAENLAAPSQHQRNSYPLNVEATLTSGLTPSGYPPAIPEPEKPKCEGLVLNPRFSLWLQGYPDAWACCAERATQSYRKSPRSSSKRSSKANHEPARA